MQHILPYPYFLVTMLKHQFVNKIENIKVTRTISVSTLYHHQAESVPIMFSLWAMKLKILITRKNVCLALTMLGTHPW